MTFDATTRGAELGARCWELGTRENPPAPRPQHPDPAPSATSFDSNTREMIGCELAAEVIRSSGELRLQVVGSSMLPVLWPGDLLSVCKHDDAPPSPGDLVVFRRAGRLITHRVVEVRSPESGVGDREWRIK